MAKKTKKEELIEEIVNTEVKNEEVGGDKKKELAKLLNDINKKFGDNAINVGFKKNEDTEELTEMERIPTGNISLNVALGGGIPRGRFTHICGMLSCTKTSLSLHIIREAQKLGYVCSFYDGEGTTDEAYMKHIGIDTESLIYSRPDGLEECMQSILDLQKSGLVHLALIDSIESLPPTKEYESTMQDTVQLGIKPKLLGEFFRKYQAGNNRLVRERKKPFTLIGLNQVREKIGVTHGDPSYAPGGRSIGFTASVDIHMRKGDWIVEGTGVDKEIVGQVVKFKVEKNKTFKRMQTGEIDFYLDSNNSAGIPSGFYDNFKAIIIEAVDWGVIDKGGAWFFLDKETPNEMKFQGLQSLINYLRENPDYVNVLEERVLKIVKKG